MGRVYIAMSGGVDSSTAAYILCRDGHDVAGVIMRLHDNMIKLPDGSSIASSLAAADDARRVADRLGISLEVYDFRPEFRKTVIEDFAASYERGRTPNPCIECNRQLKFEALYDACINSTAKEEEAQCRDMDAAPPMLATGHYAVIERSPGGRYMLRKARDLSKDQSYFLYTLTQKQLARTLFPLGVLTKKDVREIAEEQGLITARKKDSQDICFVPGGDYAGFIRSYTGREYPGGDFVDADGRVLGRHKGIINYTVGQRKGLGIALGRPAYVCRIDADANRVILGDNSDLFTTELTAGRFSWLSVDAPSGDIRARVRIRFRHEESSASVIPLAEDRVKIIFDKPQRAAASGQSAVVYDGDYILGGGIIE